MNSVTTGAIGSPRGTVLNRKAVIALEKRLHAIGRQTVFRIDAFGRVAFAAHLAGGFGRSAFQSLDFMFRVAVRAGRRLADSFREGLAVNARQQILRLLGMAFAAGHGQLRKVQG